MVDRLGKRVRTSHGSGTVVCRSESERVLGGVRWVVRLDNNGSVTMSDAQVKAYEIV